MRKILNNAKCSKAVFLVEDGGEDMIVVKIIGEVNEETDKAIKLVSSQLVAVETTEVDLSKYIDPKLMKTLYKNKKAFQAIEKECLFTVEDAK